MQYRYYRRRFLNQRGFHAGGYVLATVENTAKEPDRRGCASVDFTLADCGRQITLDFDVCPEDLENSLHKLDLLVETLLGFRAALVKEGKLAAARQARKQAGTAAPRRR